MCTTSDPVSKWSKALSISKRSARSESLRDIEIDMARLELDVLEHAGGRFRWEHLAVDEFDELLNILLVGLETRETVLSQVTCPVCGLKATCDLGGGVLVDEVVEESAQDAALQPDRDDLDGTSRLCTQFSALIHH